MTLRKLLLLHKHYKNDYDFRLKKVSYSELDEQISHSGEFLPD